MNVQEVVDVRNDLLLLKLPLQLLYVQIVVFLAETSVFQKQ